MRGKKIFVTGGAGFIGSSLIERVVDRNKIVVFDNFHRNALRYTHLRSHPNLTVVKGDVLDFRTLTRAIKGSQIVVHCAAIAGVDTVLSMPAKTMEVALIGTYNVLRAARAQPRLERFMDVSTSEVFGSYAFNARESDSTTLGTVGEARWTYAVSKLATEHLTLNYVYEFGFPAVSIRPFNIFGPRQVGVGAIHTFIRRALRSRPLLIHNEGSQIRSWCYIDDIVEGILLCLRKKAAIGHSFNIGNPRNTLTIYNLAKEIKRLTGSSSDIRFVKKNIVDVHLRVPNTDKAKRLLGYESRMDLEEGLKRTIEWYRAIPDDKTGAS